MLESPSQNNSPGKVRANAPVSAPAAESFCEPAPGALDAGLNHVFFNDKTSQAGSGPVNVPALNRRIAWLNAKIAAGQIASFAYLAAVGGGSLAYLTSATGLKTKAVCALGTAALVALRRYGFRRIDRLADQAEPATAEYQRLAEALKRVAHKAGIDESKLPRLVVQNCATGQPITLIDRLIKKPLLGCSADLVKRLDDRELDSVLAHELSHLNRWHSRFSSLGAYCGCVAIPACFAAATTLALKMAWGRLPGFEVLSHFNSVAIGVSAGVIATYGAFMVIHKQFTDFISRHNETKTDLRSLLITGDPEGFVRALFKLHAPLEEQGKKLASTHPGPAARAVEIQKLCH